MEQLQTASITKVSYNDPISVSKVSCLMDGYQRESVQIHSTSLILKKPNDKHKGRCQAIFPAR